MITEPADGVTDVPQRKPQTLKRNEGRSHGTTAAFPAVVLAAGSKRRVVWWLLLMAVGAGAWYYQLLWWPRIAALVRPNPAASTRPAPRPIPVRTTLVRQHDLNLYLDALGTVTALRTVTIKSRVDGEIMKVAFTEGEMVSEDELLAEIDSRLYEAQLKQAEGQLTKDKANLELAKLTLARNQELRRSNSAAMQQIDEAAAQVHQLEGTIQTDEAMVDHAKLQLSYCQITAPISGRIGLRLVDQGNIVHANDPMGIAVITQVQPIALVFTIPQDDIPRVQKRLLEGQTLTVDAYDRDFKTKLDTGKLLAIDNQVDSTTGTLRLKAKFDNKGGQLFPNQFVNVRLLVDTRRDAIIVDGAAVQRGPNSTFVYVVKPDETVDLRTVVIGPSEGSETSLESGLTAGEIVVTDGIDKLQRGSKVTTREKDKEPRGDKSTTKSSEEPATKVSQ
jgi:membrane fusion protein, multidrug efflux system